MSAERLQKVLAAAGIASRRDCEELIEAGRVTVNGKVMTTLGARVDPESDEILVDGAPIKTAEARTYVLLNKPTGVISTAEDTHSRPTVVEQVGSDARLFPVGRLDQDSEGLILLTDDGALTQRLTHPSYNVEKEYRALLDRAPDADALRDWRDGVELDGEMTAPAWVDLKEVTDEGAWVRIVLQEGRKRQIREVARLLGYDVHRLIRVREGSLSLGDLPIGQSRPLTDDEIEGLWKHVGGRPGADNGREDDGASRRRRSIATLGAVAATRGPRGRDDRPQRDDRPRREYTDGPPRDDRPRSGGYGDRPQSNDRPRSGGYGQRDDRPRSGGYGDRPQSNDRPRTGGYGQRDDRPRSGGVYGGRPQSNDRPRSGGYGDRPQSNDRPRTGGYGDRPRSGGYGDRPQSNDRPRSGGYGQRDERPRSGGVYGGRPQRDDRPRTGGYGERPRSGGYGDRPQSNDRPRSGGYGERPRSGSYGDRPQSNDRPRSGGYGDRPRDDRPRSGGYNDRPRPDGNTNRGDRPMPPRPEGRSERPRREESEE